MSPQLLGREVGPIGFGLMGMTWRPNPISTESAIQTMKAALTLGANFWNAGTFYGTPEYNSLHLLHAYFSKYPEDAPKVVLSIKGALNMATNTLDASPAGIDKEIEYILKILDGKKKLDIFECARVDPKTPIETTMAALTKHVEKGNLGGIGLSEVKAETIARAAKVAKIAAVELEVSLFSTEALSDGTGATCAQLGIPIVAYSPLSRGFLTGKPYTSNAQIPEGDFRKTLPRFQDSVFGKNLELVGEVEKIAKRKGATVPQIAIGWIVAQGKVGGQPAYLPIPGATTVQRVDENMKLVELDAEDLNEIAEVLKSFPVEGGRYGGDQAKMLNQ